MGLALLSLLFIGAGLWWCYRVPEHDRYYQWGIAVAVFFLLGVVGLVLEALGIYF